MKEGNAGSTQNWSDYIDSLKVFRAPTARLERSLRLLADELQTPASESEDRTGRNDPGVMPPDAAR